MTNSESPIGVFDSGLGGLTVMKELVKVLPQENILYFADTAHLPYGEKSPRYLIERAAAILSFFEKKHVKLVVVACHTASAHILGHTQSSIPLLGIIQSSIDSLKLHSKKRIAILATKATIDSKIYQQRILQEISSAKVFPIACPKFVPLIETGNIHHPTAKSIVHETLKELHGQQIDAALLGSTHYPLIQPLIKEELGLSVQLIDPAPVFANKVHHFLCEQQLLNKTEPKGVYQFFSSR